MSEAEWMAEKDPLALLRYLTRNNACTRKLRLFAVAMCRLGWTRLSDERSRRAVEVAERYADSQALQTDLRGARVAALALRDRGGVAVLALNSAVDRAEVAAYQAALLGECSCSADRTCDLIRDQFGNPFRRVRFSAYWRTHNVVQLATTIYRERSFAELPVLADALEDAGCTNEAMLRHCREGASSGHARGCWVLDFVQGRTWEPRAHAPRRRLVGSQF